MCGHTSTIRYWLNNKKHTIFLFLFDIRPVYFNIFSWCTPMTWMPRLIRVLFAGLAKWQGSIECQQGNYPLNIFRWVMGGKRIQDMGNCILIQGCHRKIDMFFLFAIPFLRPWWFLENHGFYQTLCHRKTKHKNRFFSRTSSEFWSFCPFVGYGHVPHTLYLQIGNSLPNLPFFTETCDLHVAHESERITNHLQKYSILEWTIQLFPSPRSGVDFAQHV